MRPHPRGADTNPSSPRAWGTCDRCGLIWNHYKLRWQFDWRGLNTNNLRILVCPPCEDEMQRQLGVILLPPDPPAIMNARPENYTIDELMSVLEDQSSAPYTGFGNILTDQDGNELFSN